MARVACQVGNTGSCSATIIALVLGEDEDPAVKGLIAQVKEWMAWWKQNNAFRIRVARCWAAKKAFLAKQKESNKWRWARGPITAMILTLQRIGWDPVAPSKWKSRQGGIWQVGDDATDLSELLLALGEDAKR